MSVLDVATVEELRETTRRFLQRAEHSWERAADLGWAGLLVPEEHGGSDGGMGAVVAVAHEVGYHLAPSPFLSSAVLGASAIDLGGETHQRARWLPRLADGTATATVAFTGQDGRPGTERLGVRAERRGHGWRLDGLAGFVLDVESADVVVTAAQDGNGGVGLFLVERGTPGVTIEPAPALDGTRRFGTLRLERADVEAATLERSPAATVIADVMDRGVVALAADAMGAASRALDLAVAYATQRVQFGRPIGSFQAIKHKLADMYVSVQCGTAAVEGAARALDEHQSTAARLVAVAGAFGREAAATVTGDAIQAHGGIGFTWEHDCHRLFKRAKLDESLLGDVFVQWERVASEVLGRVQAP